MQLIKYFVTVIAVSFLIVASATWAINKGLVRSGVDFYGKMNAAGDLSKKTDLLLVGSSRILVHADPAILDSITGLHAYNYGLNAGTIKTCFNIIQYALHFQKEVKAIVLNIDYNMFDIAHDPYKDAYYYPFEKRLDGFLLNDSGSPKLVHTLRFMDIALYDDFVKYAAIDGWIRPGRTITGLYEGYYPHTTLNDFTDIPPPNGNKVNAPFSEEGLKVLVDCINLCRQNKLNLVLVVAPYYKKSAPEKYYANYYTIIDRVREIATQKDVPFFDYTSLFIATDPGYFYNVNHLNSKGAGIYSAALADSLKKYMDTHARQ